MSQKINIDRELNELIVRFKRLKKAIDEENTLSPAKKAAAMYVDRLLAETKNDLASQETKAAQHLAKTLQAKGILGSRPPPRQPTDEEMFGHLVKSEEDVKAAEKNWGNSINNWLSEVSKPINSRFKTPEEEQAYWSRIKVNDNSGGGNEGY